MFVSLQFLPADLIKLRLDSLRSQAKLAGSNDRSPKRIKEEPDRAIFSSQEIIDLTQHEEL
jgi:hypothetical protein